MMPAQAAARWMWTTLQREGTLSQPQAVAALVARFGTGLTQHNTRGAVSISVTVRKAFSRLHRGRARWYPSPDAGWRLDGSE
jgi:hypothetical protein